MVSLVRTNAQEQDFVLMVNLLDEDLAKRDGKEHSFYAQYNQLENIQHVVLAYEVNTVIGCGAMKFFFEDSMEIKRMYTLPAFRGQGVASLILHELESWAGELGMKRYVLETGKRQPEAIRFYQKNAYQQIPNYGQYINVENSVCFEKSLTLVK